jgi:predicted metal-dependent hydrolase
MSISGLRCLEISGTVDIFALVSSMFEKLSLSRKQVPKKGPYWIELEDGLMVEVTHRKMKNLRLSIRADDGIVRLSAPLRAGQKTITAFITTSLPWIRRQLSHLQATGKPRPSSFLSGESHLLWGDLYKLHVIERVGRPRIILSGGVIQLYIAPTATVGERGRFLNTWYRKILAARIPSLLTKWESVVGKSAHGWGIRNMRTKWGTCNTTNSHLWFSLALAKKPVEFLEFIIVHELVHLHERHHNKRFYALMDQFMPAWRTISKLETTS